MKRFDLPDLASPRVRADPHPLYARLRNEAPVLRTRLSWWIPPVWLISRYDDVAAILKDDERFSNVYKLPWTPKWMRPLYRSILTADPPDHTRLRALVQKAFTPRVVEQLRPRGSLPPPGCLESERHSRRGPARKPVLTRWRR